MALPFIDDQLPRAMFWIGIGFVLFASVVAFWIGRPIIWLSFRNEKFNAAFRYALVRLRDASEAVAFYRGEAAERTGLRKLFAPVVANYKRYVARSLGFNGWNWSMSQLIVPLPYLLQFPRFFCRRDHPRRDDPVGLGVRQHPGRAVVLPQRLRPVRRLPRRDHPSARPGHRQRGRPGAADHHHAACVDGTVQLDDIEVRTPDGKQLVNPLDLRLEVGDTLVVTGASGTGKTTLLRSLAELWPFTTGHADAAVRAERDDVPVPDAVCSARRPARRRELSRTRRHHRRPDADSGRWRRWRCRIWSARLDEVLDWAKVLSPGEQQRIAFARILLTKPKAVFLDESTSALDEGLEFMLYNLVRTELPDTILVSVSHRSTVEQHHTHELRAARRRRMAVRPGRGRGEQNPRRC